MARASRTITYSADHTGFVTVVEPELRRRIEATVHPIAAQRGLRVSCEPMKVKNAKGEPIAGISDLTWRARRGLSPGFTVTLRHSPTNYFQVSVNAKPFYPQAALLSLSLGLAVSVIWIPYLLDHFFALTASPLFIAFVLAAWVVFFLALREPFLALVVAVLSTVAWGFVAGFGAGWALGAASGVRTHGAVARPALAAVIAGLERPSPPTQLIAPYAPAPKSMRYAAPAPPARSAAASFASPLAPSRSADQGEAPCPRCGAGVPLGASSCSWCGLALEW